LHVVHQEDGFAIVQGDAAQVNLTCADDQHSLRHGFTHEYLESDGARIEDLQILLGHENGHRWFPSGVSSSSALAGCAGQVPVALERWDELI